MITIATNSDNDIYRDVSGNLAMLTDIKALANVSKNVVLTTLGEPQYDQQNGIPYFETIFTDTPKIDLFQAAQVDALEKLADVNRVSNYEYTQENGIYSYSLIEHTTFGDIQLNG